MVPSQLGLLILVAGLVMIHYGTTGTLFPLTPIVPPAPGTLGNTQSNVGLGSVTSTR